ncbi:MAG: RpiB/LacA/LacB family sugar-phosphate isomerase, partial [Chloroflexota bacterium]
MANSLDDAEIHRIVQSVVQNVMGQSAYESVQSSGKKIIAIGADHGGFELKEALKSDITALGFEISDMGTNGKDAVDYPDFAHAVAQSVSSGNAWRGIMIDGAGIGSCIVANKVPGVRAGM